MAQPYRMELEAGAYHLLNHGSYRADIRKMPKLMGHDHVETTQIYSHLMRNPGPGVRSPLDQP